MGDLLGIVGLRDSKRMRRERLGLFSYGNEAEKAFV